MRLVSKFASKILAKLIPYEMISTWTVNRCFNLQSILKISKKCKLKWTYFWRSVWQPCARYFIFLIDYIDLHPDYNTEPIEWHNVCELITLIKANEYVDRKQMLPTREHNWQICIFIYSPLIWHSWILCHALPWILLRWKGGWTFWHEHVLVSHKTRKTVPHRINCLTQHAYIYTAWQMVRWFIHHTLIGQQKDL